MTYRITGLDPAQFARFFVMSDDELAHNLGRRVVADTGRGFPCRVSLEDARAGERLLLAHYTHHDVETPYRAAYAIYVRESAREAAVYHDRTPPVFEGRTLSLRAFDSHGTLSKAQLAAPGEADAAIRALLGDQGITYIDAHNAAYGCFAARIERDGQ